MKFSTCITVLDCKQDLQTGLDLGLVPPEVLRDFFDLEKQPFIAELTQRYQVVN